MFFQRQKKRSYQVTPSTIILMLYTCMLMTKETFSSGFSDTSDTCIGMCYQYNLLEAIKKDKNGHRLVSNLSLRQGHLLKWPYCGFLAKQLEYGR